MFEIYLEKLEFYVVWINLKDFSGLEIIEIELCVVVVMGGIEYSEVRKCIIIK